MSYSGCLNKYIWTILLEYYYKADFKGLLIKSTPAADLQADFSFDINVLITNLNFFGVSPGYGVKQLALCQLV